MATMYVSFDSTIASIKVSDYTGHNYNDGKAYTSSPVMLTDLPNNPTESKSIWIKVTATLASGYSWPCVEKIYEDGVLKTTDKFTSSCNYTIKPARSIDLSQATSSGGGGGGATGYILQVGSDGWPNILYSVTVESGATKKTFTQSHNAINYSSQQKITSVSLTGNAVKNNWTGTIYWGTSSGAKTYPIADVEAGSVTMRSSIEPIDCTGTRTIYFTASGNYYHKVKYFANGGSWKSGSDPYVDLVLDGSSSGTATPSNNLQRDGYRLLGWSTSSTATEEIYGVNTSIGPLTADFTVWAVWIKNTVTITLNANGGIFVDNRSSERKYPSQTIGGRFEFTEPSKLVSRDKYKLLGWSANPNATSATYPADGGWVQIGGTDATYYAIWQLSVVTITLNANGGKWSDGDTEKTFNKNVGDGLDFKDYGPDADNPISRLYHLLAGWSTSPTGSASFDPDEVVSIGATNASYYAVWKHHIDPFYWDGNKGLTDSTLIVKGAPISNLTAERWNRLKNKVKEISGARGIVYNPSYVISGKTQITAVEFNTVRRALSYVTGVGALPNEVSPKDKILASYFNGSPSLKSALNAAIIAWNNS